ncbi:hypothetical protein DPMN_017292 [Dreissena polymorpha]|uniref:Uncharacterized protein n=1 Tax=Dreissena polymorpha TaxID=45954 RepID=A0A9D4NB39_DREPO|nr:hypothetical protein DPMN_017292 [Dreissena polymorpha]
MNISAANQLSALMNQNDVIHCHKYDVNFAEGAQIWSPCEFQRIIESGIREAAANSQDGIQLKLNHFYIATY